MNRVHETKQISSTTFHGCDLLLFQLDRLLAVAVTGELQCAALCHPPISVGEQKAVPDHS